MDEQLRAEEQLALVDAQPSVSADDYAALEETAYLMRSPANARRLHIAYTDALAGRNLVHRDLSELEAPTEPAVRRFVAHAH